MRWAAVSRARGLASTDHVAFGRVGVSLRFCGVSPERCCWLLVGVWDGTVDGLVYVSAINMVGMSLRIREVSPQLC